MGVTAASRIQVMLGTEDHADAIAAFYRQVWSPDATAESFVASQRAAKAENVAAPGEAPPIAIVLEGGRVIGYCGSVPQRLWDGVAEHPAYWVKGLMVLPEYRRGPIGYLVWKQLAEQLTCATMMIVTPAARRLFSAFGYTDFGPVTNFVRLLSPGRVAQRLDVGSLGLGLPSWVKTGMRVAQRTGLARLAGAGAGVVSDCAAAMTRVTARSATESSVEPPSREELDAMWRDVRGTITASQVRDGRYLRWRFGANGAAPGLGPEGGNSRYLFIAARERGGRLLGIAVLLRPRAMSDPRLRGLQVATISDIVFPLAQQAVGLALLGAAERAARAEGADAILCSASHRALRRLLRRQAYLALPGNVHFFHRDATGAGRWPRELASWWLTRGDGGADEVF